MDLDKLHENVKKLDALLTDRQTGMATWWIMLGKFVGEIWIIANESLMED